MNDNSKIMEDMAKMMSGLFQGAGTMRSDMERNMRQKFQDLMSADLVGREEFEVFREMVVALKLQQDSLIARLDKLEGLNKSANPSAKPSANPSDKPAASSAKKAKTPRKTTPKA